MSSDPLTVLVTGAGGFIGGHVARRLAEAGYCVRAMVRDPTRLRVVDPDAPNLELVQADLTDRTSLRAAALGTDAVVHCAADTRVRSYAVTQAVTVEGTRQMLLAARAAGARAFVHISSIAVYGGGPRGHEDAPLLPYGDRYGDAKIRAELALWQEGTESRPGVIVLRPPSVYGPGAGVWTTTLSRAVARGWPACLDGGRYLFPYVYVDNLVDAVILGLRAAVERELASPSPLVSTYNIVDGAVTWAAYLDYFGRAYSKPVRSAPSWPLYALAHAAERTAGLFGRRSLLNPASLRYLTLRALPGYTAERAERELGWRPRVSLDEGMASSLEWLRSRPKHGVRRIGEVGLSDGS